LSLAIWARAASVSLSGQIVTRLWQWFGIVISD
jgi:hypothetical protein